MKQTLKAAREYPEIKIGDRIWCSCIPQCEIRGKVLLIIPNTKEYQVQSSRYSGTEFIERRWAEKSAMQLII